MREKQEIILKHLREGKSQRQICRETGIARETIRRYTRAYEQKLQELKIEKDDIVYLHQPTAIIGGQSCFLSKIHFVS